MHHRPIPAAWNPPERREKDKTGESRRDAEQGQERKKRSSGQKIFRCVQHCGAPVGHLWGCGSWDLSMAGIPRQIPHKFLSCLATWPTVHSLSIWIRLLIISLLSLSFCFFFVSLLPRFPPARVFFRAAALKSTSQKETSSTRSRVGVSRWEETCGWTKIDSQGKLPRRRHVGACVCAHKQTHVTDCNDMSLAPSASSYFNATCGPSHFWGPRARTQDYAEQKSQQKSHLYNPTEPFWADSKPHTLNRQLINSFWMKLVTQMEMAFQGVENKFSSVSLQHGSLAAATGNNYVLFSG